MKEAILLGARGLLFGQDDMTMLRDASVKWVTELRKAIEESSWPLEGDPFNLGLGLQFLGVVSSQ